MRRTSRAAKPVQVSRLTIAADRVTALDGEERYVYYMLGYLFNELMLVQKLLAYSLPKHDDDRPLRLQPEMGQAMFLFRIAAGKLWEAKLVMETADFGQTLQRSFLPLHQGSADRFKAWRRRVGEAKWLKNLRNWHSFHYPDYKDWVPLIRSTEGWTDDDIFMSAQSGNVFYAGSDAMAQYWMFGQLAPNSPRDGVEPMIDQLIEMIRDFNSLVEDVLGAFVADRLLPPNVIPTALGSVASPEFDRVSLPFWTRMRSKPSNGHG